jgi:hypothetical protein
VLDLIQNIAIAVALALLGVGVGVMSMSPPDYNIARTAAIGFGIAIVIASLLWLSNTSQPLIGQIIIALMAAALVFIGCPAAYRWINFKEHSQQLYAGRLEVGDKIITDGLLKPGAQIQIGRSHVFFSDSVLQNVLNTWKGDKLTVEIVDGKLMVSTAVRDNAGNILAELNRNEWKVAPPPKTWDRNYTNDTLEVVNSEGYVALQIRILNNIVQMQGAWWIDLGLPNGKRRIVIRETPPEQLQGDYGAQIILCVPTDAACGRIEPLFVYPSDLHLGQLR